MTKTSKTPGKHAISAARSARPTRRHGNKQCHQQQHKDLQDAKYHKRDLIWLIIILLLFFYYYYHHHHHYYYYHYYYYYY